MSRSGWCNLAVKVRNGAEVDLMSGSARHGACRIHPCGEGVDPKGRAMAAVNIRCIEGIELDGVPVTPFDGRSL